MQFYKNLARHYDTVFPFCEETLTFLKQYARGDGARVLDVGCATGSYLRAFENDGYEPFGVEYVEELVGYPEKTMIGDMRTLPHYMNGRMALVYCIGNTLVHLANRGEVLWTLKGFHRILEDGGYAVIQILNYERIMKNRVESLPTIDKETVTFERLYEYDKAGKISFNGILTDKQTKERSISSVSLLPVQPDDLVKSAFDAGFEGVSLFGDYSGADFDPEKSFMLIAVLKKKDAGIVFDMG